LKFESVDLKKRVDDYVILVKNQVKVQLLLNHSEIHIMRWWLRDQTMAWTKINNCRHWKKNYRHSRI